MVELFLIFLFLFIKYRDRLWDFNYDRLNAYLTEKESRHGVARWGLIQTGWMMLTLFFYVRPASHCSYMGKYYAMLAAHPFSFDPANPVPHRILTSLLSYLMFMRGQLIIVTNLLIAATLIFVVYLYFRKSKSEPADAFVAAAIIAFSTVTLNTVYYGGYNDSLSFLLVFLMWMLRRQRMVFYLLFFLGLLNRESVAFLIPWFVLISFAPGDRITRRAIELLTGFGGSMGVYYLFRNWIAQHQEIQYSATYYLSELLSNPLGMLGYHFDAFGLGGFAVFKLMWVVPLAAMISMWRAGKMREHASIALLLLCSAGQLLIAYDTTRLLALAFMILPLSLLHLYGSNAFNFKRWILPLFLLNLFVPNLMVAGAKIDIMQSLVSYGISYALR